MQLEQYNSGKDSTRFDRELDKSLKEDSSWNRASPVGFNDLFTIDMFTEDGKLVVEVTMPGFKKEEIRLHASGDTLDLTAEHDDKEQAGAKREYFLRESSRSYRRQITLPGGAKSGKAEAEFINGTLMVTMPIKKQAEIKEVAIK